MDSGPSSSLSLNDASAQGLTSFLGFGSSCVASETSSLEITIVVVLFKALGFSSLGGASEPLGDSSSKRTFNPLFLWLLNGPMGLICLFGLIGRVSKSNGPMDLFGLFGLIGRVSKSNGPMGLIGLISPVSKSNGPMGLFGLISPVSK